MSNSFAFIVILLMIVVGIFLVLASEKDKTRREIRAGIQDWYIRAQEGIRIDELNPDFEPRKDDEPIDDIQLPEASTEAEECSNNKEEKETADMQES